MKNKITWIDEDLCQCNICGASANCPENILHFNFCKLVSLDKFFVGKDLYKARHERKNK
jgi:hypothetical protein